VTEEEKKKKPLRLAPLPMERPKREQRATIFDSLVSGGWSTSSLVSPAIACVATVAVIWGITQHAVNDAVLVLSAFGLGVGLFGFRSVSESEGDLGGAGGAIAGIIWNAAVFLLALFLRLH
jgi:hypothetical protein